MHRLKYIIAIMLGTAALATTSLWALACLLPDKDICVGDYHLAMGSLFKDDKPFWRSDAFLYVCWGNATKRGYEIEVSNYGFCLSRAWGWKPSRHPPGNREEVIYNDGSPDHSGGWGRPGFMVYEWFHYKADASLEEIWNSNLFIPHWLLTQTSWGIFVCYIAIFSVRSFIINKRRRMGGFPVVLPSPAPLGATATGAN